MTNTINFEITRDQIDANEVLIDEQTSTITGTYTVSNTGTLNIVASGNKNIPFGDVASAVAIKVASTENITLQVNGSTTTFANVTDMIITGAFTELNATNESSTTTAIVTYEIYGATSAGTTPSSPVQTYTTTPITLSNDNWYVVVDRTGATTINLPSAIGKNGKVYSIKNINTGVITIDPYLSQTIDGISTMTLPTQWGAVTLISDNSNWLKYNGIGLE